MAGCQRGALQVAVNINTFNFFLIFQANTHFLRPLLAWLGTCRKWLGGLLGGGHDGGVATTNTAMAAAAGAASNTTRRIGGDMCPKVWGNGIVCAVEEKHIVNGVEHVKQQTGRTVFIVAQL